MLFGAHIGKTTGTWRKSSTELHIMPDTNTAGAQAFIKQNAELFKRVNDELRKYWPRVMEMYAAICPTRPDGSPVLPNTDFHEFVLNWDIECNFHTDKSDAGWGFCVVIPFGEFTGGELIFPGLGQSAHLIAGDIMVFPLPCSSTAMEKSRLVSAIVLSSTAVPTTSTDPTLSLCSRASINKPNFLTASSSFSSPSCPASDQRKLRPTTRHPFWFSFLFFLFKFKPKNGSPSSSQRQDLGRRMLRC